jgi:hypothetical protein
MIIDSYLRRLLLVDAGSCTIAALLLIGAAAPLGSLLGLPQPLLFWAGIILLPFVALLVVGGARCHPPRPMCIVNSGVKRQVVGPPDVG